MSERISRKLQQSGFCYIGYRYAILSVVGSWWEDISQSWGKLRKIRSSSLDSGIFRFNLTIYPIALGFM
jgi:hypothetical protein